MALVSSKKILLKAKKGGYAVGAFNAFNLESVQAIIGAAEELKAPVILQTTEKALEYAGTENLADLIIPIAKKSRAQIALHLDHGSSLAWCKKAISFGWTSVMIDASALDFNKNVALTKKVVSFARRKKVSVEAELGRLQGIEEGMHVSERDSFLTDPIKAQEFVEKTKVDVLAVAVGTSHGAFKFKGEALIDFNRIKEISFVTGLPLALHGASSVKKEVINKAVSLGIKLEEARGVDENSIRKAISSGITKINIDTDLRLAFTVAVKGFLYFNTREFDPRKFLGEAREAVKDTVKEKIKLFGSEGKA
ncbi:MAG: class II fructose-bisphosphate aldolase [Candidatus Diapherotrites archaeon]